MTDICGGFAPLYGSIDLETNSILLISRCMDIELLKSRNWYKFEPTNQHTHMNVCVYIYVCACVHVRACVRDTRRCYP